MMRQTITGWLTLLGVVLCFGMAHSQTTIHPDSAAAGEWLATLIGEWEGTATAYFPRDTGRSPRVERVTASCEWALGKAYVECRSVWTTDEGSVRRLITYFNYNHRSGEFDILFLYDNWPGKVNYPLAFDPEQRTISGRDTFTGPGGVDAEERVSWRIADDGNTISGLEHNHFASDSDGYWPKTFEFEWRRK